MLTAAEIDRVIAAAGAHVDSGRGPSPLIDIDASGFDEKSDGYAVHRIARLIADRRAEGNRAYTLQKELNSTKQEVKAVGEMLEAEKARVSELLNADLERFKNDPAALRRALGEHVDEIRTRRRKAQLDLAAVDNELKVIGASTPDFSGWARATLAVGAALVIAAAGVVWISKTWGDQAPSTEVQVVYNIADMIQGLLLGAGALVAGVAYALTALRRTDLRG